MARKRQVTRTVQVTDVIMQCFDTLNNRAITIETTITGFYKNNDDVFKIAAKELETNTIKPVKVLQSEQHIRIYGMLESEFIKYSNIIEKR